MRYRRLVFPLVVLSGIGTLGSMAIDQWVTRSTASSLHDQVEDIPFRQTALVLGCSEYLTNGRINRFFLHRVNAAAELFHAGKCHYLIVSGDHGRSNYNEPAAMKKALINRGVPSRRIVEDFAGFRTLDSVVRAREVFLQEEMIVVSQRFHNERALFIADRRNIKLEGFNAKDVSVTGRIRTRLREILARTKTAVDLFVSNKQPRFLGEPIPIPGGR